MPIPDMTGLPPFAQFQDMVDKMNMFVQQYNNLMLSLDSLNVVSLTADHIDAGTLNAGIVTIRADYAGGAYIVLDKNGIRINDGTQDTFIADTSGNVTLKGTIEALAGHIGGFTIENDRLSSDSGNGIIQGGTIIGSEIKTAKSTYPRSEMSVLDHLFAAYSSANESVKITPVYNGSPSVVFTDGGIPKGSMAVPSGGGLGIVTAGTTDINLQSARDVKLDSSRDINLHSLRDTLLEPTGNLKINGSNGWSGSFNLISAVNFTSETVTFTTVTVKKGIITNVA